MMDMGLGRNVTRRQLRELERQRKTWPKVLEELHPREWQHITTCPLPDRVWRSRHFLVQGFNEPGPMAMIRLSVSKPIPQEGGWRDGISWDDLQQVKNECGFGESDAVEVYPRDCDLVNVANMRHLWVYPPTYSLPFAWRETPVAHGKLPPAPPCSALDLAMKFHEIYERLAPQFGYETKQETRAFDPTSKNGQLMVAVCAEINAGKAS